MRDAPDGTQQIGRYFSWFAWIAALFVLYFLFDGALEKQVNPNQQVETFRDGNNAVVVLTQNRAGHYVANGLINQRSVTFLLDTGATQVAVPGRLAGSLGLSSGTRVQVQTANGVTSAYQTQIEVLQLGDIRLQNVSATIVPDYQSDHILLGMSALRALEFTQRNGELTIRQTNL
ncbi:MAG: clan AA aspartic protease [Idiomarinaceae bacterium HL-53]|nr:MAG: clan AA aspartic protease [Idiomarinaceae bacterium HL-53]CUS47375.1 aspartyl protease family protein [Idiomarinaceae bacterium HL-53]